MQKNELVSRYEQAAAILPSRLRKAALAVSDGEKAAAEELRLRAGRPLTVLLPGGEAALDAEVEPEADVTGVQYVYVIVDYGE